jgi:carboxymethylenebutenolidase
MSQSETLMARDGHAFNAYIAKPSGAPQAGIVVIQEIFGLTHFVRSVTDSFAAAGYLAVAPALFDRVRRDIHLGYSREEIEQGHGYSMQIDAAKSLLDVGAAAAFARHAGKVAVVGFCWGGRLAWQAACDVRIDAAVSYYGARISQHLTRTPACPMMFHVGDHDESIPPSEVAKIRAAFLSGVFHVYENCGHAFANPDRPERYNAEAAALARLRTDSFLATVLG